MRLCLFTFFSVFFLLQCQRPQPEKGVPFLAHNPVVDGLLDEHLQSLPLQNFPNIWQFDNPVTDTVPVHYRMAYTPTHLYLYIEAASPSINYRNRGFINGDGFKLLLGLPQPDGQTDEYYDLVFSASKDSTYWARKRVWEHNHDQGFNRPLSNKSLFRETAANGVSGFEALIAWSDIPPYHPWFTKNMGYNLYFAKAIGDTITNGYAAVPDEGIWDEELPKRSYAALPFQQPKPTEQSVFLLQPEQRHIDYQSALKVKGVSLFIPTGEQAVEIAILKGIDTIVWQGQFALPYGKKLREAVFALPTEALSPGVYELVLAPTETASDTLSFVIFPPMDFRKIQAEIQQNQHGLPKGTISTLLFKLAEIERQRTALKPYQTGEDLYAYIIEFEQDYEAFRSGRDPYDHLQGPYRRAFQSKQDGSYQPYSIKLPATYDPQKQYPLLVFLHGSGQDDRGALDLARSNGQFIEVAPFGRDRYYCFSSDSAQTDIQEAIEDVVQHFAVDREQIIISGFSMGGYGALRTFYEQPDLYKGVAVFAGHPHLASDWLEGEHPDFLKGEYAKVLSQMPVFIYHGQEDGSLPVDKIQDLLPVLQEVGADLEVHIVPDKAHEYPDEATQQAYAEWLGRLLTD